MLGLLLLATIKPASALALSSTEKSARAHCLRDTIDWLITPTGI